MTTAKSNPEENIFREWFTQLSHKRIRTLRLISQTFFFIIFNGVIIGLSKIPFPVPVVQPVGAPFATVWGGFEALQYVLSQGQFPFLVIGVFFLTGAIFGKLTCGWACPIGFWQDLVALFPLSKWKPSRPLNRDLQEIGGFILWTVVIVVGILGWQRNQGTLVTDNIWSTIPYGVVDPAATMMVTYFYAFFWGVLPGDGSNSFITDTGSLFLWKTAILLLITYVSIKVPRAYCRWICPTGALLGYASKKSILTIKRDPVKCVDGCQKCEDACPTGVPITDEDPKGISNSLCINCGNCVDACPDAMSFAIRL